MNPAEGWEEEYVVEETEETLEVSLSGSISAIRPQEHCEAPAAFCKGFV